MRYLARSGGLLGFADLTRRRGLDPERLLAAAGLSATALSNPDLYLSYPRLARLYALTADALDDPAFALQLAQRQGLEVVGALGVWLCEQPTLGDALLGLQRHLGFHARGISMASRVDAASIRLDLSLAFANQADCTQLLLLSLMLVEQGLRDLQPAHPRPVRAWVGLGAPEPRLAQACRQAFGCPVQFGTAWALQYPLALLAEPVAVAPALRARLARHWRDDWQLAPVSMVMQVERSIAALLPTGACSLTMVARLIGLHPRTLQDRLRAEGTRYDRLLATVRQRLACTHLADSDIALTPLALDLGFADLAVFSRAFKRWTGQSPSRWRLTRSSG